MLILGSLAKQAFTRGIYRHDEGISNAADVADIIRRNIAPQTKKLQFFLVEAFPTCERLPAANRKSISIPGIRKVHSITVSKGGLLIKKLSCLDCRAEGLCLKCSDEDPTVMSDQATTGDADDEDQEEEDEIHDEEGGQSDLSSSDDDDSEEDFQCGTIIWAKQMAHTLYWPGRVVSQSHVPQHLHKRLFGPTNRGKVVIQWYPINDVQFSAVKVCNTDVLAENRIDRARAAKSSSIRDAYEQAIADVRGD